MPGSRGRQRHGRRLRRGRGGGHRAGREGRRGRFRPRDPYQPLYPPEWPPSGRSNGSPGSCTGADGVHILPAAEAKLRKARKLGYGELPICRAKTQDSLSDNPKLRGRPRSFTITVRDLEISAGAGFLVALTGEIVRMPGLPKRPAAERIDVDDQGRIMGLS
ncbi:MAG: formate--tetrahydrofolate ligase [Singulisphaera sp.]